MDAIAATFWPSAEDTRRKARKFYFQSPNMSCLTTGLEAIHEDAAFLLTVGRFLFAVELLCLQLRTPRPATEPRDGPTRNFHEYRKNTPPARNSGLPEFTPKIPRKYQKNTPKIPKMPILGIFSVFSGYFLGVPDFRPRGYFFGIFRGNSGSGHLGAL